MLLHFSFNKKILVGVGFEKMHRHSNLVRRGNPSGVQWRSASLVWYLVTRSNWACLYWSFRSVTTTWEACKTRKQGKAPARRGKERANKGLEMCWPRYTYKIQMPLLFHVWCWMYLEIFVGFFAVRTSGEEARQIRQQGMREYPRSSTPPKPTTLPLSFFPFFFFVPTLFSHFSPSFPPFSFRPFFFSSFFLSWPPLFFFGFSYFFFFFFLLFLLPFFLCVCVCVCILYVCACVFGNSMCVGRW